MRKLAVVTGIFLIASLAWGGRSLLDEARELERKNLYKEAKILLEKALTQNPKRPLRFRILIELADIDYQHLSNPSEALAYLLEAKNLYPERFPKMDEVYYRLGLVYEKLGRYVDAAKAFEQVATKFKKSPYFEDALEGVERAFKKNFREWVAIVGGTPITKLELDDRIQEFPPFFRGRYETEEGRKELLERMIDEIILYREAEEKKIYLHSDVAKQLERSRMQILERAFYKMEVSDKVKVSDSELAKYYRKHREEFKVPEKVTIRRIVLKSKEEAKKVLELARKGEPFDSLAMKYSVTSDRERGGLLENLTRNSKPREIVETAFKLKEGQISDIITLRDSTFAIIKVEKKTPSRYRTLEEVKETIESRIKHDKEKERWEELRKELRKKYNVQYPDEFKKSMEKELGEEIEVGRKEK
jgi:peptidyl-prolyl cis-trans isomerase C